MATEQQRHATTASWSAVAAALLCGAAVAMNIGKVPVAMPELRREFGLSLVSAGYVSSMINTLAVTCALFFGLAAGRMGALRMCMAGLLVSIAGTAGALFASGQASLLLSRFAEGAGMVAVAVSAPTLLTAASNPASRRFVLSMWSAYLPAGVGLVMLIAPLAMQSAGWRSLWILTAAVLCASVLALALSRRQYRVPQNMPSDANLYAEAKQALASATPWMLGLAMATWTLQHFALIVWLPTFLREQRGLSPATVSLLSCLMVLCNVPGNLFGGRLLQRGVKRGSMIAGGSLLTGLAGAGIFLDVFPDAARYALCLVLSFAGGVIPAAVLSSSVALARTPRQIAILQGLFMQLSNLGPFAGPPVIAMLVDMRGQWQDAYIAIGAAAAVGIALGLAIRRRQV